MKLYVSNAFSLNMINKALQDVAVDILLTPMTAEQVALEVTCAKATDSLSVSMSGNATVKLFNSVCSTDLGLDHCKIDLGQDDKLIVMQYNGPRLTEDTVSVPKGGTLKFFMVEVVVPTEE